MLSILSCHVTAKLVPVLAHQTEQRHLDSHTQKKNPRHFSSSTQLPSFASHYNLSSNRAPAWASPCHSRFLPTAGLIFGYYSFPQYANHSRPSASSFPLTLKVLVLSDWWNAGETRTGTGKANGRSVCAFPDDSLWSAGKKASRRAGKNIQQLVTIFLHYARFFFASVLLFRFRSKLIYIEI